MDKWLTRFVLAIIAVVFAVVSAEVNIRDADPAAAPAARQSEDGVPEGHIPPTDWACGDRGAGPCDAYPVEIKSPLASDSVVEEEVTRWVDHWWTGAQGPVQRGLERMGRYEAYIDAELAIRGLPRSLRYLPLIESDYDPLAVSPAGAAGLWQLMPETARGLGLEVDSLVDQRFDVYASTPAALDYLAALHDRFQCWSLALAAYNGGPTRIERAIRWYGGARPRDDALFGHIRDRLPRETRDYVPKFVASIRLANRSALTGTHRDEHSGCRGTQGSSIDQRCISGLALDRRALIEYPVR